ncbi:MAG: hypothetical protein O3B01_07485 [Planctomycetota bacterium]|nr:hypothetical protein [Planctomycetota bacterium]
MRIPLLSLFFCLPALNALENIASPARDGFVFSFQATFKEKESHLIFRLSGNDSHTLHLSTNKLVAQKSRGLVQKHKEEWKLNKGIEYRFLIQCRKKSFAVCVDGRRVMSLPREEGDISLTVEEVNDATIVSTRFQPCETVHFADDFMRQEDQGSGWETLTGIWQLARATQLEFAASPFRLQAIEGHEAQCVKGFPFWRDYLFQASTRIHNDKASTGLAFYRLGDTEFLFRWNGTTKLFELLYKSGKETEILSTREGDLEKRQWYRLGVAVCGTLVRCFVDETEVLRGHSDRLAQGGIGLYASHGSEPVEFDDVLVEGLPFEEGLFWSMKHSELVRWIRSAQPHNEIINPTFINDRYMQNWTSDSQAVTSKEELLATSGKSHYGYTFFRAPSDWWRSTGRWDAYSRWSCRPEWSFFAGTDDQLALIWNKRRFPGDICVDIYAANPMVTMRPPFYGETSLNLTICGDGENPFSGYTVSMGGWNLPVTNLYRQDKVVAASTEAIIPVSKPSGYHREWFHLQLARRGERVSFSFEGKQTFEFEDPKPLKGSRVGIWSLESGVSIARAQIKYSDETEMWTKIEKKNELKEAEGWHTLDGDQGALPIAMNERGRQFVRLINKRPGGTFAASPPGLPINLAKSPVISFSYRTTEAARANIYLQIGDHWHQLRFTGPADTRSPVTKLGELPSVKSDGKWHQARFDLFPAILNSHTKEPFIIQTIRIGLLESGDLLAAALGANPRGTHWDIANLEFSASRETMSRPTLSQEKDPLFEDFEQGIDNWENFGGLDGAMPFADSDAGGKGTSLQLYKATHGGVFGARWKIKAINLNDHPVLELDYRMPENVRVGLLTRIGNQWFSIVFSPAANAQFSNQAAVKVERDNQWHSLQLPLLELFTRTFPNNDSRWVNEIIFSDQGENSPNGYRGNIKGTRYWLDNVRFVRGDKTKTTETFKADSQPEIPQPLVTVKYPETLFFESFESNRMPWRDWCEGTVMLAPLGPFGEHCARIFGYREDAYFSTMLWESWVDLDRYPILSFDYRLPPTASLGFAVNLDDYFYLLPFSRQVNLETLNAKTKAEYVTTLAGDCIADDRWHSTEINFLDYLKKRFPDRQSFRIRDLRTQTMGGGNPLGQSCYFDNVAFHSRRAGEVKIGWKVSEQTTQVKYSLSVKPEVAAEQFGSDGSNEIVKKLAAGTYYFHLSAMSGDGAWAEPVHRKIVLE